MLEEDVRRDEYAKRCSQGSSGKKVVRPSQRKEMALWAVNYRGLSIAGACRTFQISETCYRYKSRLSDENELIADWLLSLTKAKRTWGFGLCFLYLRNVKGFRGTTSGFSYLSGVGVEYAYQAQEAPKTG